MEGFPGLQRGICGKPRQWYCLGIGGMRERKREVWLGDAHLRTPPFVIFLALSSLSPPSPPSYSSFFLTSLLFLLALALVFLPSHNSWSRWAIGSKDGWERACTASWRVEILLIFFPGLVDEEGEIGGVCT